jgi:hypothetical protein
MPPSQNLDNNPFTSMLPQTTTISTSYLSDELRKRKTDEAEFARFVSEADAFKAVTHKIINLSFSGKQRLLRGVLDGPIAIGSSSLIPHVGRDPEDEVMKILDSVE